MSLSKLRQYSPYILYVAALLIFVAYLHNNADRYQQLLDLSVGSLLMLLVLVLAGVLGRGCINKSFYRGIGIPLTLNEGIGLASVNTLANQLPFAGGLIAKGVYLKQIYELAYTRFLSATLALYVCFVAVSGAMGIVVLVYQALVNKAAISGLLFLGFSGMLASIVLLWLPIDVSFIPGKWGHRLARLIDGRKVLSQNWWLVGKLVGLQILITLLVAGRFWIVFRALSQDVTLTQCILFSSANILTTLVTISPGGLGVREAIVASVASLLGFEAGVSVVAVVIDRLVETLVVITLGTVYTYILGKKVASAQSEPETLRAVKGD